jgi:hypothetical protein
MDLETSKQFNSKENPSQKRVALVKFNFSEAF